MTLFLFKCNSVEEEMCKGEELYFLVWCVVCVVP